MTIRSEIRSETIDEIAYERQRQIDAEGWTPDHDDQHMDGSLAVAAACYAAPAVVGVGLTDLKWPFDEEWWKPKDKRRNLVRAAALIVAEIERLDRADHRKSASRAALRSGGET